MEEPGEASSRPSPAKEALAKIRDLKRRLAEAESSRHEPIAIVSTACRFPRSSDSPEAFWHSLLEGTDEVSELPEERWDLDAYYDEDPDAPGKMYARRGTFLDRIDEMDADFFGISPREATWIDPQQRIFLEVSWEALERAGWASEECGKDTGVFVGWMHNDYQNEASESILDLNPYIATGSAGSFLCGRLSYFLGIQGPSIAIDTACSSSLVSLHLACQSLRDRECDRALAGGVNIMVSPKTTIMTCKLHALSPEGNSRAFDASADGYLRGEGCGVVALRRLSDAVRDGDPVLAVIRGSAITHNGFSSGLTAPNPESQQRVIRRALEQAGVAPSDIDYLEAHGTGTELGDPIELNAAAAVLGEGRESGNPLLVGSVKTNLGHLEAAAGIAGVIKTVLALQNGRIPAHLHFETPNPHIDWDRLPVSVVTENTDWPSGERRLAGVSAFGMSGTNAHIVIEAAPEAAVGEESPAEGNAGKNGSDPEASDPGTPRLLFLSGRTEEAVRDLAGNYRDWLGIHHGADLAAVCREAARGRRHFEHRAAILARTNEDALGALSCLAGGGEDPSVFTGQQGRSHPVVAWQFTGQGSQFLGMGRQLYEREPVFRDTLDQCRDLLAGFREGDLLEVMFGDEESLADTYWTQPALFAIHIGLAELMKSWGFRPDIVFGHSLGQYAAACVAGMLDWRDGMRLIHERSRLTASLPEGGGMAAIFATSRDVDEMLKEHPGLSVAAHNGTHTVVSGPSDSVDAVSGAFEKAGVRTTRLNTSHAFHSGLLDPILDEFEKVADSIEFRTAECPLICNVSGEALPADRIVDGAYWREQLREAVRYEESVRGLAGHGCEVVVELGPQPHLTGMAAACWAGPPSALLPTMQSERDEVECLRETVARLYCHGVRPDFDAVTGDAGTAGDWILPTYPFQRQKHWGPKRPGASRVKESTRHPLLGAERALAGVEGETRFEGEIDVDRPRWLEDHRVFEDIVFPGAGFVEMALAATRGASVLEDLAFEMPLLVGGPVALQTVKRGGSEGGSLEIFSSPGEGAPWSRHVRATLSPVEGTSAGSVSIAELQEKCSSELDVEAFYEMLAGLGIHYGTEFRTIRSLHEGEGEVLAKLSLSGDHRGFGIPPMLLDGAFHSLASGLLRDPESSLFLPVGIGKFTMHAPVTGDLWCHGHWNETEGDVRTADLTILDERGVVVARAENLQVRAVSRSALRRMVGSTSERLLYHVTWRPTNLPVVSERPGQWLVAGENPDETSRVVESLAGHGQDCVEVILRRDADAPAEPEWDGDRVTVRAEDGEHWFSVLTERFPEGDPVQLSGVVWSTRTVDPELPEAPSEDYSRLHFGGLLALLQTLRRRKTEWLDRGLQILTSHAMAVGNEEPVVPDCTQFWGIGRVIANEYPTLRCRLIDIVDLEDAGSGLGDLFLTESRESQVALRSGEAFVPRLVPARAPGEPESLPVNAESTYLITGGLGMLGRRAAEWLGARGAGTIVLVSRREPTESTLEMIAEIEESGSAVRVLHADIGVEEEVEKLLGRIEEELPPLRGIIHAAGVLNDGLLADQTWESFQKVLAPKKTGAWKLHELTAEQPLDFFILYSSAASVMGSPGQANYASANAFLDGLAYARRNAGLPALSVNFGPWNEGMAATETVTKAVALQGMTPLTADEAHEAVERLVENGAIQATMLDADWSRMRQRYPVEAPPLLDELWPEATAMGQGGAMLLEKLREAEESGTPAEELLLTHIQGELQQVLSLPQPPEPDVPLAELGLDSLMAVEFATRLQQQVGSGYAIPPTIAFDYPSAARLTHHLLDLIESSPAEEIAAPVRVATDEESIAVIGLGCRFPGADGPDAYWELLRHGIDATCEIPPDRWDLDRFYDPEPAPGKIYTKRGGFLPDIGEFDADFFGISDRDAAWMDPQHRLLLEVSWQAMEEAGIVPDRLTDAQVGVFMGIMSTDYAQIREQLDPDIIEGSHGAGLSHSAGVGRLSYLFGFEGPSIAVDTASSSSLVAVCQAARSLLDGDCNLALAGGVNAILSPTNSLLLCKGGILSPDGRCKSFSAEADGFGRGEGCGVVVLKRRSDAERDGDRILGLIRGSAIGHNGHNGGLTAPSGRSQQGMIHKALANAGVAPSEVHYLEAHATGTELGDPIELRAAAEVFGKGRDAENDLLVGSAKANLGHLEAAGGISGLIKVILSMTHGVIPRQIHFDTPSPHIPWDRIRARVVTEETPWPDPDRPLAGVSALGMTGTNAHVLVEGVPRVAPASASPGKARRSHHLLVLSAASPEGLSELEQRYAARLEGEPDLDFAALCDSAATGRRLCEYRTAVVAADAEEARAALVSGSRDGSSGAWTGRRDAPGDLAWIFPAANPDCLEAVRELYEGEPVVHEIIESCDEILRERDPDVETLREILFGKGDPEEGARVETLDRPGWTETGTFVLEMALAKLWQSWGIEADVVLGEGVGQIAAACAAGMLDWEDGLVLAAERGRLLENGGGEISEKDLDHYEELADAMDHRPADRPILCSFAAAAVPVHKVLAGVYWRNSLVEADRFDDALEALLGMECGSVLVLGSRTGRIGSKLDEAGVPRVLPCLEDDTAASRSLLAALARLFVAGSRPDLENLGKPWRTTRLRLPTYPYQRKRYWITDIGAELPDSSGEERQAVESPVTH